jgi:hypothetical protein
MQKKTQRPVQFEITEQTRDAVATRIATAHLKPGQFLFPSRVTKSPRRRTGIGDRGAIRHRAVMASVSINTNNAAIAFIVPSMLVPDTFTFTASITNPSGNFTYAGASDATTGTFVAPGFGGPGFWTSLPAIFGIEGRVIAASVPEPSTIVLLALGLGVVIVIKRFKPAERRDARISNLGSSRTVATCDPSACVELAAL